MALSLVESIRKFPSLGKELSRKNFYPKKKKKSRPAVQKHFTEVSSFLIWIMWSMTHVLWFLFFFNYTCFSKLSKMEYVCLSMPYAKLAWSAHKLHICKWQLLQVKWFVQIQCQSETWAAIGFSDFWIIQLLLYIKGSCMCANNVLRDEIYLLS